MVFVGKDRKQKTQLGGHVMERESQEIRSRAHTIIRGVNKSNSGIVQKMRERDNYYYERQG